MKGAFPLCARAHAIQYLEPQMAMEEDVGGEREGIHTHPPSRIPPARAALGAARNQGKIRERNVWSPVSHPHPPSCNSALQRPMGGEVREKGTAS